MSINENLTQPDDETPEQAITVQPSAMTAYAGAADWTSNGEDAEQAAVSPLALLHAVRRHWLVIFSTGLACAGLAGTALFLALRPQYKAEATLELRPSDPRLLTAGPDEAQRGVSNEFEIFRDTQQHLVKNYNVIKTAINDPRLKTRPCIAREDARHNAIAWLTEAVSVSFPTKAAGVMLVSSTQPDKDDATAIVNAVVEAYMTQVVDKDRILRRERLAQLTEISINKEDEVRKKREQLKQELANMGFGDDETMKTRTAMAAAMYSEFERQFQLMRAEHRVVAGKLEDAKASLKDIESPDAEIPQTEIVMLLNTNPLYRELQTRLGYLDQLERMHTVTAMPGVKEPPVYQRSKAEHAATKAQLDDLESKSRDMVRNAKRIGLQSDIKHLERQLEVSTDQIASYEKEVEKKRAEAENVGRSSVAAQMSQNEVNNLQKILQDVAEEKERLRVELGAPSRVLIMGERSAPAAVPENETNAKLRLLFIVAGALLAGLLPGTGIVLWDLSRAKINASSDVSKGLKVSVIGAVPRIPPAVMRRLGDATQRSQIWKMRFTEAVDGVAARLLRKAERDQVRVVLVSSAVAGEGKTTLATQVAMSLARAQRKTVLVDFDLRRPTLDGALGLPSGPGICEALRGQGDVIDMVQPTETPYLSVVTAGSWNRRVPADLSSGAVGTLLERLRVNFDFVVIDSSPLLPTVDARLVCQHVDSVLLAIFRDVSQSNKIKAAQELLDAFGVRDVEAVVTGGEEHANTKHLAYHAALFEDSADVAGNAGEIKS